MCKRRRVTAQPLRHKGTLVDRARADIGGFGLSGSEDLSGNAQIGLGYAVGNNTDLNISWRYSGINYNTGDTPDSGYNSYRNGFEIGLKFFF